MFKKATTAASGTSASSRSQAEKPIRRLSPVAFLASAAAALLTAGIVAGPLVSTAGAAPSPQSTSHALATAGLGYTPLSSPVRIADTRAGATDPATYAGKTLAAGAALTVDVPTADIPSNASAVVVNVTAISPASAGYLSVYPGGSTNSGTANVTFTSGQTVGNLVTVGLGPDSSSSSTQSFTVYNGPSNGGAVDFTADLEGYYAPATATSGGLYNALAPARVYDSRTSSGEPGAGTTLTGGGSDNVTVTGVGGVPASATAVVLNVAVTNTTASSYISAYPTGSAPAVPTASQNFLAGETLSAQVISGVGTGGDVTISNLAGSADIVVDVDGYFTAPGGTGSLLTILSSPVRLLDTRPTGVAPGSSATTTVQGAGATAGVLSLADIATAGNYLTAYATGSTAPLAANVNYTTGDTYNIVENSAYATTATGGGISVLNGPSGGSPANVVVDEFGYFAPATATATTYTVTPSTPQNLPPSETGTPTAGAITYTATGMGTTPVDIELFTGSNVMASGSGFTFTNNGTVATQGTPGAYISAVNGAAVSGTTTTQINGVSSVAGSITFTINSSSLESDYPVVFADDAAHTLPVNSSGGPTAAYGVGGEATWTAVTAAPGDYDIYVQTVDTSNSTFVGCEHPVTDSATCFTFALTPPSSVTNEYTYDIGPCCSSEFDITEAQFLSVLSGATPPFTDPSGPTRQVDGDEVYVEVGDAGAASYFEEDGDVPAAPTAVAASVPPTSPFETVSFTAPVNAAAPYSDVAGYRIYALQETGSGSAGTYPILTSVPNGDPVLPAGVTESNDSANTNPYISFPGLGAGTYEFEVQAYNSDGFNSPLSAPSAPLVITAPAATPVSIESVLTQGTNAGNNLRTLDNGDTLQFVYDNVSATTPLTVATNASVDLVDSYGAEVSLTNGVNATFSVSAGGTTLTIAVTGAPALINAATPGQDSPTPTALNTDTHNIDDAVLSDVGIGNAGGAWNLAVSGLPIAPAPYPSVTRVFESDPTAGAAHTITNQVDIPDAFGDPTQAMADATTSTVTLPAGDDSAIVGDPVTIYNALGVVIGTGTYTDAADNTITTTAPFLPGSTIYVVYQDSGPTSPGEGATSGGPSNQPSASDAVVVPGTPDVTDVTGAGKTLTVTWGTPVTEQASASPANYVVEDFADDVIATGTAVSGSGTDTYTLTLDNALTNDTDYELLVAPATVVDSSAQVNVAQDFDFSTDADTITAVTGPYVSSSDTTTNTDPTWTGTATVAGTATESTVQANFNDEGFSTAGVSITSGSGTNNVAWTYTPTASEGAPLANGTYTLSFEVTDSDGSSATSSGFSFTATGSTLSITGAFTAPGPIGTAGIVVSFNNPVTCPNTAGDDAAWVYMTTYTGPGNIGVGPSSPTSIVQSGPDGCFLVSAVAFSPDEYGTLTYTQPGTNSDRVVGNPGPLLASTSTPVTADSDPSLSSVAATTIPQRITVTYSQPILCTTVSTGDYTVTLNGVMTNVTGAVCNGTIVGDSSSTVALTVSSTFGLDAVAVTNGGSVTTQEGNHETVNTVSGLATV